jgi:hypothetical protein
LYGIADQWQLSGTVLSPCGSLFNDGEAMLMQQSKYHIRVMRPTFERAILTVEASSEEAAMQAALQEAGRLTDDQWELQGAEREEPVVEIALPEEEAEGSDADVLAFLRDAQYAYALLQADLAEASGSFIVPTWQRRQPGLAVGGYYKRLERGTVGDLWGGGGRVYHLAQPADAFRECSEFLCRTRQAPR